MSFDPIDLEGSGPRMDTPVWAPGDPADRCRRWTPQRKIALLNALRMGQLDRDAVLVRYGLTEGEIVEWQSGLAAAGLDGLTLKRLRTRRMKASPGYGATATPTRPPPKARKR